MNEYKEKTEVELTFLSCYCTDIFWGSLFVCSDVIGISRSLVVVKKGRLSKSFNFIRLVAFTSIILRIAFCVSW